MKQMTGWQKAERRAFYYENHSLYTAQEMADKLGITLSAVQKALATLGLKSKRQEIPTQTMKHHQRVAVVKSMPTTKTLKEVCERTGYTYRLVQRIAKAEGIRFAMPTYAYVRREFPEETKRWYADRYLTMTNIEMAAELGVQKGTIMRNLKIMGLIRPDHIKAKMLSEGGKSGASVVNAERKRIADLKKEAMRIEQEVKRRAKSQADERKRLSKPEKFSNGEQPGKLVIRHPYQPNDPSMHYVPVLNPETGQKYLVERRK